MTLKEFKEKYRIQNTEHNLETGDYIIITEIFRRNDGQRIDGIKTSLNIAETKRWIQDSQSMISMHEITWPMIIDKSKRGQLDHFAQIIRIDDFFPLNSETDISGLD